MARVEGRDEEQAAAVTEVCICVVGLGTVGQWVLRVPRHRHRGSPAATGSSRRSSASRPAMASSTTQVVSTCAPSSSMLPASGRSPSIRVALTGRIDRARDKAARSRNAHLKEVVMLELSGVTLSARVAPTALPARIRLRDWREPQRRPLPRLPGRRVTLIGPAPARSSPAKASSAISSRSRHPPRAPETCVPRIAHTSLVATSVMATPSIDTRPPSTTKVRNVSPSGLSRRTRAVAVVPV